MKWILMILMVCSLSSFAQDDGGYEPEPMPDEIDDGYQDPNDVPERDEHDLEEERIRRAELEHEASLEPPREP